MMMMTMMMMMMMMMILTSTALHFYCAISPEGRPGMFDVSLLSGISGLSFYIPFLSPLVFFCLVLLFFLSRHFFLLMVHTTDFFSSRKLKYFSLRVRLFCMALVEHLGDDS